VLPISTFTVSSHPLTCDVGVEMTGEARMVTCLFHAARLESLWSIVSPEIFMVASSIGSKPFLMIFLMSIELLPKLRDE